MKLQFGILNAFSVILCLPPLPLFEHLHLETGRTVVYINIASFLHWFLLWIGFLEFMVICIFRVPLRDIGFPATRTNQNH